MESRNRKYKSCFPKWNQRWNQRESTGINRNQQESRKGKWNQGTAHVDTTSNGDSTGLITRNGDGGIKKGEYIMNWAELRDKNRRINAALKALNDRPNKSMDFDWLLEKCNWHDIEWMLKEGMIESTPRGYRLTAKGEGHRGTYA